MADNTIKVIAEYIQKNEELLKEFREDLQGLSQDTDNASASAKEHESATDSESLSLTDLHSAVGLAKQGYELLNTVYDETIAKTLEQGNVIRELKSVTGDSAEEISRAVQVLDDYKISSDSLLTTQKFLAKQGYSLNIETLAKLSAEYTKLGTVQERSKFLTDNLGKAGLAYAEVLGKGEDAIRAQGDAVADGLIFNEKQLDQMRELEIHQDSVNDNWDAIKNKISMAVIPALDDLTTGFLDGARAQEILDEQGLKGLPVYDKRYQAAVAQAAAEREAADAAMLETQAVTDLSDSQEELAAATEEANRANQGLLGTMQNIGSEMQNYNSKQEEVKSKQDEVKAKIDELIAQGWSPLSQKVQDLQKDYDDLGLKSNELAEEHRIAMGKMQYDLLMTKLSADGLTDEEFNIMQQAGIMFGQFDQESIDAAKNFDTVTQAVADGKLKVEDMQKALDLLPTMKNIDVVINAIANVTYNGGGGQAAEEQLGNQDDNRTGYAGGGVARGPASGHRELLHGTEGIFTEEQMAHMAPVGMGGGGNVTVVIQVQSPITILDKQQGGDALLQYVEYGVKTLQERGVL